MTVAQQTIQEEIQDLLREGPEGALRREQNAFDDAVNRRGRSLVLFGAGGIGRKTLAGLRQIGIEPLAFTDNNRALWGKQVNGLEVLPPSDAAIRYSNTAAFVVTIWCGEGTDRMRDRVGFLRTLGCTHVVTFGQLFWKYPKIYLPHYSAAPAHQVQNAAAAVLEAADLWADEASRREYLSQLRWRLHFDFDGLADPVRHPIYFPPDLCPLTPDEVFVDCGAYDGDTIRGFLDQAKDGFRKIIAFEPDPASFRELSALVSTLPCKNAIEIHEAATGAEKGVVRFSGDGTSAASVGSGPLEVSCVTLDEALAGQIPTYIKMDIEGAEIDAIRGAARVIRDHAPVLAICSYHKQDHLWAIPRLIHSIRPDYRFYLRPHLIEVWDLVCYAVPANRPGGRPLQ
jgi:FkbM family methyltransferase